MQLFSINTELFKLDGGAMFGVVPKTLWQKKVTPDANNLVSIAMRLLLIQEGNRLILIDTGIGDKQNEKFFSHYFLDKTHTLERSLQHYGFSYDDITDVILTHLHFDHVGGAITRKNEQLVPTFKNATYWSNQAHWQWATHPNPREKASFLQENILPIQESGQLQFIEVNKNGSTPFTEHITIRFSFGHTHAMMLPIIQYKNKTIIYGADLLISTHHLPIAWIPAYDIAPLTSMQEKAELLKECAEQQHIIFFEHDADTECCTVKQGSKGFEIDQRFSIDQIN